MTKAQRIKLIKEAQELGLKSITIDSVTYELSHIMAKTPQYVPEAEAKDLVNPLSVLDELSDEEILYWSSPHYDDLQEQKIKRAQQLKDEGM